MDAWTQVSYDDYVGMCGCPPVMGTDAMLAHYRITMAQWSQIAGHWNGIIATNPQYMQHGLRVEQEAARIRAGGMPRPVVIGAAPPDEPSAKAVSGAMPGAVPPPAVSGAMPGAVPPPGFGAAPTLPSGYGAPQPGYGPQAGYAPHPSQPPQSPQVPSGYPAPAYAQPGYPQPGYPAPPHPSYPPPQQAWPQPPQQPPQAYRPAPDINAQAAAFGNEVGSAFSAFGSALGSMVSGVVSTFSYGQPVMVQWSDGRRYPGSVIIQQNGQVQVAFPDGRKVWVPQHCVATR